MQINLYVPIFVCVPHYLYKHQTTNVSFFKETNQFYESSVSAKKTLPNIQWSIYEAKTQSTVSTIRNRLEYWAKIFWEMILKCK